jgi:riboflavin kinase / FMN adenylyltransferase
MSELPTTITGTVVRGAGSARRFGYPTANLAIDSLALDEGVYLGRTSYGDTADVPSLIFYGTPHALPAITTPRFEVHLLDRDTNLYDETLMVRLEKFVRPNEKLSDEDLKKTIENDFNIAREHFHV